MEIRYVERGLANNFGEYIEVNQYLKEYPELHDAILKHELSHSNQPGFTKKDFILDIGPTNVNYRKLLQFMFKHPKSFLQLAPFYKNGEIFVYDLNMIIVYATLLGIAGIAILLALIL